MLPRMEDVRVAGACANPAPIQNGESVAPLVATILANRTWKLIQRAIRHAQNNLLEQFLDEFNYTSAKDAYVILCLRREGVFQ